MSPNSHQQLIFRHQSAGLAGSQDLNNASLDRANHSQLGKRCLFFLALFLVATSAFAQFAVDSSIRIVIGPAAALAGSGRLLLLAKKVDPTAKEPVEKVGGSNPDFVIGREVSGLAAKQWVSFRADDLCYPAWINQLPAGEYWMQAILDCNHTCAYSGRQGGDIVSEVERVSVPLRGVPTLTISNTLPVPGFWEYAPGFPMLKPEEEATVNARIKPFAFTSPALTAFMGRPIEMRGLVVTPEDYDTNNETYPVIYSTHGFGAGMTFLCDQAVAVMRQMHQKRLPPMIWVFLDESCPTGTHEFADSVNNGPWGQALTTELILEIERQYRTDHSVGSRFITGHSSGGWAALWLQVKYPKLFGGAWATAPDFCDFTDFWGVDITQPGARMKLERWQQVEPVLGDYGGQMSSFEAVFSPRGPDGRPMPLYDRATLKIDPAVAAYWREHWDISQIIRNQWSTLASDLDGKIHVIVGTKDNAGLDRSARELQAAFETVGGRATFTYIPGKGHFDLYQEGSERMALRRNIAWEMWKTARPRSQLVDPGPPSVPVLPRNEK